VNVRRAAGFLPGTGLGFLPRSRTGELNVIDTVNFNVLKFITLPPGSRPIGVKVAATVEGLCQQRTRRNGFRARQPHVELLNTIKVGVRSVGDSAVTLRKVLYTGERPSDDDPSSIWRPTKGNRADQAGSSPWAVAVVPNAN